MKKSGGSLNLKNISETIFKTSEKIYKHMYLKKKGFTHEITKVSALKFPCAMIISPFVKTIVEKRHFSKVQTSERLHVAVFHGPDGFHQLYFVCVFCSAFQWTIQILVRNVEIIDKDNTNTEFHWIGFEINNESQFKTKARGLSHLSMWCISIWNVNNASTLNILPFVYDVASVISKL